MQIVRKVTKAEGEMQIISQSKKDTDKNTNVRMTEREKQIISQSKKDTDKNTNSQ
jgi:hypothetical protein